MATTTGWDIGPDIAPLTLRAVPGFPVTWPLDPIPPGWTPVAPVFEVRLHDGTELTYPLAVTPFGATSEWAVTLTGAETSALATGRHARLTDSGTAIAAGPFRAMSGWSANVTPVSMPARILAGPPGSGGTGGLSVIDNGDGTLTLTDTGQLVDNGDGTLTLTI